MSAQAHDQPWQPPTTDRFAPRKQHPTVTFGLVAAIVGWAITAFLGLMWLFVDENANCTANRGAAYQDCVRGTDLTVLTVQALVASLATASAVLVLVGASRRAGMASTPMKVAAMVTSGTLVLASIAGWIGGALGLWEPDRPRPYEPVPTSRAHITMLVGAAAGLVIGALVARLTTRGDAPSTDR